MRPGRFCGTSSGSPAGISPAPSPVVRRQARITRPQHRLTVQESLTQLPGPAGERYVELFKHGTLTVELYAPRGDDPQEPHTRDEVYVVVQGSGHFRNGETRHRFAPGDLLFVPAGVVHRFEEFTDDLAVWVLFYGPEGGEAVR
jgi:mannose-6-phosphate isomerase-like protein (cupin superfamily)